MVVITVGKIFRKEYKMGKKIVVIRDRTATKEQFDRFLFLKEEYGADVVFVDDRLEYTNDEFTKMFLTMERQGPDAICVNEDLRREMKDADILVSLISPIPTVAVNEAERLEAVCILRSGVENINLANARAKGIPVINAPGRLAVPVSEFAVGLMLAEMRNIARSHVNIYKDHEFVHDFPNAANSNTIRGRKVGIIGCGAVGKNVAKIVTAFGAKVLVYDPYMPEAAIEALGYVPMTLEELCREANIISVHYRLTAETENMINKACFDNMKPSCFFINTARAGLVDETALIEALETKKIAGAALDVFHHEPIPADHPFMKLDNVTLTGHLAGTCSDLFGLTFEIMERSLRQYFEEGTWDHLVK